LPSKVLFRKNHELDFQEKLASSGGLNIQASKKKIVAKGKGKKTTPLEIIVVLKDVTMVDHEITTSKWDFVEVHDGYEKRRSNKHLDLLFDSR
jgi:hypothetical protein